MIVFENEGELDLDAVRLMGVSVKTGTDSPVGHFGTGVKYALAVLLREGCRVDATIGSDRRVEFNTVEKNVRGEPYSVVTMSGEELGFTTRHGVDWEVWQAFRELWCNAHDEPGARVYRVPDDEDVDEPRDGLTRIIVEGAAIEKAYAARHETILQTDPIYHLGMIEAHAGESEYVFYRGIRAAKLKKRTRFTYNVLAPMTLTEDRTLKYSWIFDSKLAAAVVQAADPTFVEIVLTSTDAYLESDLSWDKDVDPSTQFFEVAERLRRAKRLSKAGQKLFTEYRAKLARYSINDPMIVEPTRTEARRVSRALERLKERGVPLDGVHLVFRTGQRHVTSQRGGIVLLPAEVLSAGDDEMALSILDGVAGVRGARVRQLCHLVLTGEWGKDEDEDELIF